MTVLSYLFVGGVFLLAGGIFEGWHVYRQARQARLAASEDWLGEGNRRVG